jgi:ATP-dependent DNA helicase RecG
MTLEELIERLKGFEWNDVEFKEAQRDVPKEAYKSVSAFANTAGGWLVFGVEEKGKQFNIVGVIEVDKVQNDFLSQLRSTDKFNRPVRVEEDQLSHEGKTLLVFFIPEADRREKPIYLNGDLDQTYIRSGGLDIRATPDEIGRFLRDASGERHDSRVLDFDIERCFDPGAIRWYRELFQQRNPSQDASLSDGDFLYHWGFLTEQKGHIYPTVASILMFGAQPSVLQILSRPVVDCQWINTASGENQLEQRWEDRLVHEGNLVSAWKALLDFYFRHAERPFSIEADTLQRSDMPPDYIAFREAAINLLIHQDYVDQGRTPFIHFYRDCTKFWNPGDAFATTEALLESGEKEIRNPRIVRSFRQIGLSEQAGTGIRAIYSNWRQLGRVPPIIVNEKGRKSFELRLNKEELITEEQLILQASLGVRLSPEEAALFAWASRQDKFSLLEARVVTGLPMPGVQGLLEKLTTQRLIEPLPSDKTPYYSLAEHLRKRFAASKPEAATATTTETRLVSGQPQEKPANLVTDQARPLRELNEVQWQLVEFCDLPRSMQEMLEQVGIKHRSFFRKTYLEPLIQGGVIQKTYPDVPNHPRQRYTLTETGIRLKERHTAKKN